MTSSITPITAASNGGDTTTTSERERPPHGLPVLRDREAKALVHLVMEALGEAHSVGHDLHTLVYDHQEVSEAQRQLLGETCACLEAAEHYLLMLGSVFDESTRPPRPGTSGS
jgi:hypothetical protein